MQFADLASLSPLPVVDLALPQKPADGFLISAPAECRKNFQADLRCRTHYEKLNKTPDVAVQCPFGFTSFAVRPFGAALTGIIPYPRQGGDAERTRAKRYPEHHMPIAALRRAARGLLEAERRVEKAETDAAKKQSVALHEIRKLNRNVKQTAERLCQKESPADIDGASPELVRILKASELMSSQFEVLELLANEGLASLPVTTVSEVYRTFDKCVRIYQPEGRNDRIVIRAHHGFNSKVRVCDKTFLIIPTVLIENAIKYSLPESRIEVDLRQEGSVCIVSVSSLCAGEVHLTPAVFERGVRVASAIEGSGNGLYLAQLIAKQHNTQIELHTAAWSAGRQRVTFVLALTTVR